MRDSSTSLGMTRTWPQLAMMVFALLASAARAQFSPGILTNDSYWSDGKAEFDIYDAQLMRGGQLRHCEVLHIFFREKMDPLSDRTLAFKETNGVAVIRMNQIWTIPVGMFIEQGSITGYWRLDTLSLARLMFVGTDGFGNLFKKLEQSGAGNSISVKFSGEIYADGILSGAVTAPANAFFYDELPLRVRTIDWRKPPVEFEIQLCPSLVSSGKFEFQPAKVSWKPVEKSIEVTVQHAAGTDRFVLDANFPHLMREWQMADGSHLKMKRGLKADYWNYSKEGDRERAFKNPMLQHPD